MGEWVLSEAVRAWRVGAQRASWPRPPPPSPPLGAKGGLVDWQQHHLVVACQHLQHWVGEGARGRRQGARAGQPSARLPASRLASPAPLLLHRAEGDAHLSSRWAGAGALARPLWHPRQDGGCLKGRFQACLCPSPGGGECSMLLAQGRVARVRGIRLDGGRGGVRAKQKRRQSPVTGSRQQLPPCRPRASALAPTRGGAGAERKCCSPRAKLRSALQGGAAGVGPRSVHPGVESGLLARQPSE